MVQESDVLNIDTSEVRRGAAAIGGEPEFEPTPAFRTRRVLIELLALAALPIILYRTYGVQNFALISGADPFIYTGYTESTRDLVQRFGYPYYAVRFGLIIPSVIAERLFGTVGGYFALRWALSAVAAAAIYFFVRRRHNWLLAAAAAVALLLNPIYIRAEMTMYSTVTGVPAVAAGFVLLLINGPRRTVTVSRIGAGLCFGMCINSNPFTLLPLVAAALAWLVTELPSGWRPAIRQAFLVALGPIVVTLAGSLIYMVRFGDGDIISPTLNAMNSLTSSTVPGSELDYRWLGYRPEIWLAPVSALSLAFAARLHHRRLTGVERSASLMTFAMWIAYVVNQFMMNGGTLETYFYTSYMIGPIVICLTLAVGAVVDAERGMSTAVAGAIALVTVLVTPILWTHLTPTLTVWSLNGVLPAAALVAIAVVAAKRWSVARWSAVAAMSVLPFAVALGSPRSVPLSAGQPFRQDPLYFQVYNTFDNSKLDVFVVASDFAAAMPRVAQEPGSIVFWFDPRDDVAVLSQWTYVGHYSALSIGGSIEFPELAPEEIVRLRERTPRFVVALSTSEDLVRDAERTVAAEGFEPRATLHSFRSGSFVLYASVLELTPMSCDGAAVGEPVFWNSLPACAAG